VAWVLADDHDATMTTNDFTLVANLFNAWVNLHVSLFLFVVFYKTDLLVSINDSPTI
jgi:hypothetical protein